MPQLPNRTAAQLWSDFHGADDFGPVSAFTLAGLPQGPFEALPLAELTVINPKKLSLAGSLVWYPRGQAAAMQRVKFEILRAAEACSFAFLRIPRSLTFRLKGGEHQVLCLSEANLSAKIGMITTPKDPLGGCKLLLGERGFMAGVRMVLMNTDMIVQKNTLWSDEILVQGSNQHGIIDMATGGLIPYGRGRISVQERAWIGRRAILLPGASIGKGAILGTAALAAKAYPPFRVIVGNPGVAKGPHRTWANTLHAITESERAFIAAHRDGLGALEE